MDNLKLRSIKKFSGSVSPVSAARDDVPVHPQQLRGRHHRPQGQQHPLPHEVLGGVSQDIAAAAARGGAGGELSGGAAQQRQQRGRRRGPQPPEGDHRGHSRGAVEGAVLDLREDMRRGVQVSHNH